MIIKHLDLFSGIGGFALAADWVWPGIEHTFVEYDPFCQAVLRKHWPEAEIHGDIRQFIADTKRGRRLHGEPQKHAAVGAHEAQRIAAASPESPVLLTGGFPCQPFSQAGRRKGTADDRYIWPPMLEAIALYRPRWVIAENVAGLITWNDGLVLETVCSDLEAQGYEVQPFVIPAVAVGAPHRRDRVWIVAFNPEHDGRDGSENRESGIARGARYKAGAHEVQQSARSASSRDNAPNTATAIGKFSGRTRARRKRPSNEHWTEDWLEVATALCRVDDGLPRRLDRNSRLKALGNAIVPQVAAEIFQAINALPSNPGEV